MRTYTAGQLKELLAGVTDDTPILKPSSDHGFVPVSGTVESVLHDEKMDYWTEDHGEELTPERQYGKRTRAIVLG